MLEEMSGKKMNIKYLSKKKYLELWQKYKDNRQYTSPPWAGIETHLEHSHVFGKSGPGTKYANELERVKDEYYNPPAPLFITVWETSGETIYKPR